MSTTTEHEVKVDESRLLNLRVMTQTLAKNMKSSDEYSYWLLCGMKAIFGDDPKATATGFRFFEYYIDRECWLEDISFVRRHLPPDHQSMFESAVCYFFAGLAYPDANSPAENPMELVALKYLELVAEIFLHKELFRVFGDTMKRFPKSQAVFDKALILFRFKACTFLVGEWDELFCSSKSVDHRWSMEKSPIVAFGMCIIYPASAKFYLNNWGPLQDYLHFLADPASPFEETLSYKTKEEELSAIMKAIQEAKVIYGV